MFSFSLKAVTHLLPIMFQFFLKNFESFGRFRFYLFLLCSRRKRLASPRSIVSVYGVFFAFVFDFTTCLKWFTRGDLNSIFWGVFNTVVMFWFFSFYTLLKS